MYFKVLSLFSAAVLGFLGAPAFAAPLPEDASSAVVYTYFTLSDRDDDVSISPDTFQAQLDEITSGDYTVMALPDILKKQRDGETLPPRTIALTFDASDDTLIREAETRLIEKNLPFTVFVSPGQLDQSAAGDLTWDDIRALGDNPLITLGLSSYAYGHIAGWSKEKLTEDMNRAKSRFREMLGKEPKLFAYPFGEYSETYAALVDQQGFTAAFGQQSGVLYPGANRLALPRFTMTEEFGDLDRFRMTSQALPFPVSEVQPATSILAANPPFPGFTVASGITGTDLGRMTCFASGLGKLSVNQLGHNRVELRFPRGFDDTRGRVNCTLPVQMSDDKNDVRYRWLGFLFSVPEAPAAETPVAQQP